LTLAPDISEILIICIQFLKTVEAYDFSPHGDELIETPFGLEHQPLYSADLTYVSG
jgi:hypothetical protein